MRSKSLFSIALASLVTLSLLHSAGAANIAGISADDNGLSLKNGAGTALTNNIGLVLQVGYFTGATITGSGTILNNPFDGTFVVLAGAGSANTRYAPGGAQPIEVGSFTANSPAPGGFQFTITFQISPADATTGSATFPSVGAPLSLRFYDSTSTASGFYNTVSSPSWDWKGFGDPAPGSGNALVFLGDTLTWQSTVLGQNVANEFKTTIAVPEPSTYALALLSFSALAFAKRFKRKQQ